MTQIISTVESIGTTKDGKNFDNSKEFSYTVEYNPDVNTTCVIIEGEIFTLDTVEKLLKQMQYIQMEGED